MPQRVIPERPRGATSQAADVIWRQITPQGGDCDKDAKTEDADMDRRGKNRRNKQREKSERQNEKLDDALERGLEEDFRRQIRSR